MIIRRKYNKKTVLISRFEEDSKRISIGVEKQGEWFGEYEIAIIVRCNSVQLHGNRKLLLVRLREEEREEEREGWKWIERRIDGRGSEIVDEKEQRRLLQRKGGRGEREY